MSSFDETVARMKSLYTYGKELNEGNNLNSRTLEYHAIAADGKSYGIVRECNKYYIKTAPKAKETLAEAYDYIGGFCNKGSYEYKSYANALKQFELKMASINEAFEGNVNIATLDPFKKNEILAEGTDKMKDELARCRQIMYNAAMIMNESTEIGATKKDDVVKFNGKQPEAETGKSGDEGYTKATANGEKDPSSGKSGNKPGEGAPFTTKAKVNEGACCEKCGKNPCECQNCNEEAGDIGDNPLMPNTENWGTEGIGKGQDPQSVGWEMDGQKRVDEEENDWASKGLPSSAGVGDADTDHNNDPFNKSINEGDEDDTNDDVENASESGDDDTFDDDSDFEGAENDDFGTEGDEPATDTDFDAGLDDEFSDDDLEGDEFGDDEFDDNELGAEDFDNEEPGSEEDLRTVVDELRAEVEALKAQLNGENTPETDDLGTETNSAELGNEEGPEFGGEEGAEIGGEEGAEIGGEEGTEIGGEKGAEIGGEESPEIGDEDNFERRLQENKAKKLDKIVESVVNKILKEEELKVFGKHPGYQKKPMELPTTGQDKNQWGEDWNDESVHSEQPFGTKIGNGDPFNKLVDAITKDVMYQLKKGIPIEGDKKKED